MVLQGTVLLPFILVYFFFARTLQVTKTQNAFGKTKTYWKDTRANYALKEESRVNRHCGLQWVCKNYWPLLGQCLPDLIHGFLVKH